MTVSTIEVAIISPPLRNSSDPEAEFKMHAPRAEERETWWDQWCLAAAAIACWLLLALGFGLDHLLAVPHSLVLICYVGAYLTGGSFAARKAFSDLRHGHANIDLLMITSGMVTPISTC